MRRSATIVGIAVVFTLAAIVWFWSTPPRPHATVAGQVGPKAPSVAAQRRAAVVGGAPRSAAGLKLNPATNVEPDPPPAAERQKNAWGKVAREVQAMNERDHERFKAALTSWVAVPANKALLEQVQQLNKEFADLPPAEQEARLPLAEALYAEGMATLRQHYADTPAGLPATK